MKPEVIMKPFTVHFKNGDSKHYPKTDTEEYQWSLTPSGDLLIYYSEKHAMLAAHIIKDQRTEAHASGTWTKVIVEMEEKENVSDSKILGAD